MAKKILKHQTNLDVRNYDENAGIVPFTALIETFHAGDNTNLGGSILTTVNTKVKVTFTGQFLTDPDWAFGVYGIIELDGKNIGGISVIRQISSIFTAEIDTPFLGIVTSLAKVTINDTVAPTTIIVEDEIDFTKIPVSILNLDKAKLTARLGRIASIDFCILQENGFEIQLEDASGCIQKEF